MNDDPDHHELARMVAEADWSELTPRLLGFASYCRSRYRIRGPSRKTAHDYVTTAVYIVLTREHGDFEGTLFSRICAVINVLVKKDAERAGAA